MLLKAQAYPDTYLKQLNTQFTKVQRQEYNLKIREFQKPIISIDTASR